ncbi:MAG TPA: hypothetical protein VMT00_14835 [Thermoanaerobaculia bacterium]|nr:hypothetical protein [Thermoanaerobaculia bacterium]
MPIDWHPAGRLTALAPWMSLRTKMRVRQGKSWGTIKSRPDPIIAGRRGVPDVATLVWRAERTDAVEVHVSAPDGPLFARSGGEGSTTGPWVRDGLVFYLQDVSGGRSPTSEHTLATTVASIESRDHPLGPIDRAERRLGLHARDGRETLTLDPAMRADHICSIIDTLLAAKSPYLAFATRTDTASRPALRENFERTIEHLLTHPLADRFVFATPEMAFGTGS